MSKIFHGLQHKLFSHTNAAHLPFNNSDYENFCPGIPVRKSRDVSVFRHFINETQEAYFKRYILGKKSWRYFLRHGRASKEATNLQILNKLGIPAPKVIATGQRRFLGSLKSCYIATESIEDSIDLEDYISKEWGLLSPQTQKEVLREISSQICEITKRIHEQHFYHYDLKWRNILLQKKGDNKFKIYLIDCPSGRISHWQKKRGQITDLSGLARLALSVLTKTQRMRFLYHYCGPHFPKEKRHKLFRQVNAHLARRYPSKKIDIISAQTQ